VKINAALYAFHKMFSKQTFKVTGISVPSGVDDQPITDRETLTGAINRVDNAVKQNPDADYYVGIEGGVEEIDEQMSTFAWAVVSTKTKIGKGKSVAFFLPPRAAQLIKNGMELGDVMDVIFKKKHSKLKNGAIGLLTGNVIDRTELYVSAVIVALIPFKQPKLYNS
jgi:inosine/xanthosine triphosphatase